MQEVQVQVRNLRSGDIIRMDKGDVFTMTVVSVHRLPGGGYKLWADTRTNVRRIIEYPANGMVWLVSARPPSPAEF